jgi:hypothetical protein
VTVDEVRRILEAKAAALVGRAADHLAALLHPDFIYVNAGGTTFDKHGYVDTYCISGRVVFIHQQVGDLDVKPVADIAAATFIVNDRFTAGGHTVSATYRSLCIFSRTEGRWLWAVGQTTTVKPVVTS